MSVYEKYKDSFADFRDYRTGTFRNKANGTETHTFNGVLLHSGLRTKNQVDVMNVPDNTSFALGRENFTMFFQNISFDYSGTHHLYSAYGTAALPRFIFRNTSSRLDFTWVSSDGTGSTLIALSAGVGVPGEKYNIFVTFDFTANVAKIYYNGQYVTETSLAATTGNFSLATGNQIGPGVGRTTDMNELTEYCGLIKGVALTAQEIAVLTSELNESIPDQLVESRVVDNTDKSYGFNGSSSFALLDERLNFTYDKSWEIQFLWKADNIAAEKVLIASTTATSSYFVRLSAVGSVIEFYQGTILKSLAFSNSFEKNKLYKIKINYDHTTGNITGIVSGGFFDTAQTGEVLTSWGNFDLNFDLIGKRGANDRYLAGDISRLKITIDGTITRFFYSDYGALTPTNITAQRGFDIIDFPFKGEMHALANERVTPVGSYIENTGIMVESGTTSRLVTDKYNSVFCRIIYGELGVGFLRGNFPQFGTWRFYLSVKELSSPSGVKMIVESNEAYVYTSTGASIVITGGKIFLRLRGVNSEVVSAIPTINQFHEYKIIRDATNWYVYFDGILYLTKPDATNYSNQGMGFRLEGNGGDKLIWSSKNHQFDFYQKT